MDEPNSIQENLTRRLKAYKLADRITFDDSALEELRKVSDGKWEFAKLYAVPAVLDALQNQRDTITAKEIQGVNMLETCELMAGGKDIWDNIRYIGTQAQNILPEVIQLKRELSLWDADRAGNAMVAISDGKLPKYVLVDKIQYEGNGTTNPTVKIPFKYDPSKEEIRAVAQDLADFISAFTGQPQEVKDISGNDFVVRGAKFMVKEKNPEKNRFLGDSNYRVATELMDGSKGIVSITREMQCKHNKKTLEAYVLSVKH